LVEALHRVFDQLDARDHIGDDLRLLPVIEEAEHVGGIGAAARSTRHRLRTTCRGMCRSDGSS